MVDPNVKKGIWESADGIHEPLPAKIIAVKPNTPLRIVNSDGKIVMYFNRCLRTLRNRLLLAISVFDFGIFIISNLVFYKRRKAGFNFIAYFHEALCIFTNWQIQFCSGTEFYHSELLSAR